MMEPIIWPLVLCPERIEVNQRPFSRTGGRTLGGLTRSTRTDRGYWLISYKGLSLFGSDRRRLWNALRVTTCGMPGLLAIPVWSHDSAAWPANADRRGMIRTRHSDHTKHSDHTPYVQKSIMLEAAQAAAIGDTVMMLRVTMGIEGVYGIRFSYKHALYETGFPREGSGEGVWVVPVFPAVRAPIPEGAALESTMPTCLVHLLADNAMDTTFTAGFFDKVDVEFVEACDEWNDRALDPFEEFPGEPIP